MNRFDSIGIYGMGIEGVSLFHWLTTHGYSNILCFDDANPSHGDSVLPLQPNSKIPECTVVFRSPGIHPKKIVEHGGAYNRISSSTQLFFDTCPSKNIIGITGTKGKGTTSTLIADMLKKHFSTESSPKIFLGGNIGTPVFDFFDTITENDIIVLELSSFQLFDLSSSPRFSVLLRTDTEHLNWHSDTLDYRNAKKNIFLHQSPSDTLIYFAESDIVQEMAKNAVAQKIEVYPSSSPLHSSVFDWITMNMETKIVESSLFQGYNPEVISVSDIALRGSFHFENVLPAIAIAFQFGVSTSTIKSVLQTFTGLPMRCEHITSKNNRFFYNDSFSTIPETTIASISTFQTPVSIILGGSEKHSDFTTLAMEISNNPRVQKIYLIGETAPRIAQSFEHASVSSNRWVFSDSLKDICNDFWESSHSGDSLLLSPGCSSFDMFPNYKERGKQFNALVHRLGDS